MKGFTREQRLESFERQYQVGQVYKLFCTFTRPPKPKRLVLVSVEPSPLLLYINTNIPSIYVDKPILFDRQVLMPVTNHSFMEYDSHIDCTKVITEFSKEDIRRQVLYEMDRQLGTISDATRQDIIKEITRSRPLELRYKMLALSGLEDSDK